MDFRNCCEFSIAKGDRVYTLHVPPDGTVGELLDVAFQLLVEARKRAIDSVEKVLPKEVPAEQAIPADKAA